MKNNLISYKAQYIFAFIPFVGLLIDWIVSWFNIYKTTKNRKYIFIHWLIWIIPMILTFGILIVCYFFLLVKITNRQLFMISCLLVSYLTCVIISYSAIFIAKKIIDTYNKRILTE